MFANKLPFQIKIKPGQFGSTSVNGILLLFGALTSIAWSIYFSVTVILLPYQIEFREGAMLVLTKLLLSGGNPFNFENQPLGMNNYGLGYNLMVLPFARLFGNTLVVHRSVTFGFIFLASLVVFWSSYKTGKNLFIALACAAFVAIGADVGAFPSAMGMFLFLVVVLIPPNHAFDRTSLWTALWVSILAFYTKPYFILGYVIVVSYLFLFISKKKSILYGTFFLLLFAVSFFVVRFVFPLYFIETVIGNMSNTFRSSEHLVGQLTQLSLYFYPVLVLAVLLFFRDILLKKEGYRKLDVLFNFSDLGQPLICYPVNYLFYSLMCAFLAFLLILGPHVGSYMSYAYQLIVPLFFLWLFQKIELSGKFGTVVVAIVLFNLFLWGSRSLPSPDVLKYEDRRNWDKLFKYVETSSNILNSPVVTAKMVEMGLNPVDSGQTIYFYNIKPYPEYILIGPAYSAIQSTGIKYAEYVERAIERREFDLIMTTDGEQSFYREELIPKYYFLDKKIVVQMQYAGQKWRILLWRPLTQ